MPLHSACDVECLDIVQVLVKAGADQLCTASTPPRHDDTTTHFPRMTPLQMAAREGHHDVVCYLNKVRENDEDLLREVKTRDDNDMAI